MAFHRQQSNRQVLRCRKQQCQWMLISIIDQFDVCRSAMKPQLGQDYGGIPAMLKDHLGSSGMTQDRLGSLGMGEDRLKSLDRLAWVRRVGRIVHDQSGSFQDLKGGSGISQDRSGFSKILPGRRRQHHPGSCRIVQDRTGSSRIVKDRQGSFSI